MRRMVSRQTATRVPALADGYPLDSAQASMRWPHRSGIPDATSITSDDLCAWLARWSAPSRKTPRIQRVRFAALRHAACASRDMRNISRRPRRAKPAYRFVAAFALGLALVVGGAPYTRGVDGTVSAQASDACALLKVDEIEPVAGKASVAEGVSNSIPAVGYGACRYVWGVGTGRFTLNVTVNETSRMFPGMSPDQIKQRLVESVRTGTADVVISEVGEAAVFKPDSPVYASAFALVKGRILGVHLEGAFAREKKDQVIGLLKSAAARL
jgi:hypothetical protein